MSRTVEYKDLKGDYILVDVRTAGEYEEATINGAVNVPLFTNEERAIIGTIYTRKSTEEAKKLGVEIVAKKLPSLYEEICNLEKQHNEIVIFCARGGMRSGSITELLGALGVKVRRIKGGYKGYRAFINEELPKVNEGVKYIMLHGNTGVGKTEILKGLRAEGYDVLDLEGCANHRGSILGAVGRGNYTTQKQFESNVYEELKNRKSNYVFVEAESKRIGRVIVPDYIHEAMRNGIHIFVDASLDFRSNLIVDEYTKVEGCNEEICDALINLKKYLGEKKVETYCELVRNNEYEEVTKELMVNYYDPMYMHSANGYTYEEKIFINSIEHGVDEMKKFIHGLPCEEEK